MPAPAQKQTNPLSYSASAPGVACHMLTCTLLLLAPAALAQKPALPSLDPNKSLTQFVLEAWGDENGLPHGNITSITQTPDGYLWLATAGGLVRFDGMRFVVYNFENTPAFKNNILRALLAASDSSLWIATDQSGLVRWKNGEFTALTTAEGLASNSVWSVCEAADGALWIHVTQGLHRWQAGKLESFALPDSVAQVRSQGLLVDKAGFLWLAVNQKVLRWRLADQQPDRPLGSAVSSQVLCLQGDRNGAVWIGTHDTGLLRYHDGRISTYTTATGLAHDRVWRVFEDRAGTIWAATEEGLSRWHNGRFDSFTVPQGLPDGRCRSLYEDREGSLWMGSYSRLYRFKAGRVTMLGEAEGLAPGPARCVFQDSAGSIWIGSITGLNRLQHGALTIFTTADGLPSNNVYALSSDNDGALWAGTEKGLARYNGRKFQSFSPGWRGSEVRALYGDASGTLWAGSLSGIITIRENGAFTPWRPELYDGDGIHWFHRDRAGNFWIAKWGSLLRVKPGPSQLSAKVESENIYARCCYEEADGTLWLGTLGNGVIRRREGVSRNFTTKQGLFDNYVWAILEDDAGYLWMSSDRGIWQVHKSDFSDLEAGRIIRLLCVPYGQSEGMRVKEGNAMGFPKAWKDREGRLWFPTMSGVAIIDPLQYIINTLPPPVHIEEMLVDTVAVAWRDYPKLPPDSKNLAITYTATSLRQPQKVQFRYRLEGYDAGWIEAGTRRTAYYTNLAPGNYRFRVIACNENNVWNDAGASLRFAIAPHFYQTGWFALLAGLLLSLTVYGGYRWRLQHLEVKQTRLEQLIAERTAQLRASDAKNKAILQALPDAIFRLSRQRNFLEFFAAPHFKTYTSPQEFLGKSITDILPAPIAHIINRAIDRAHQTGQMQVVDYELPTAGQVLHFEAYLVSSENEETLAIVRDITARKLAEKTVREFEAFRLIAEASPIAMTVTRWSDGAILFANQHVARLLAVPREKMTALHSLSLYDNPQERTKLLEIIARAGSLHNQEVKLRRPDGTAFWVLASCQRIEFNGESALLSGYYDISARKQAEELLERYARTQTALVLANKALLRTLDLDGLLSQILRAAQEALPAAEKGAVLLWEANRRRLKVRSTFGYQDARVAQLTFAAAEGHAAHAACSRQPMIIADKHADPALRYAGEIEEVRALRSAVVAPLILREEVLGVLSLEAAQPAVFHENDLELLVAFADQAALAIDNARLHRQVLASEERYRALFDDNPSMYFTIDAQGTVLSVNRYGAEELGYRAEELVGSSVLQVFHPEDRQAVLQQVQLCLQTSPRTSYWELRKIRKDGSLLWVGEFARALQSPTGEWLILIVCEDITGRKQAEREIRRLNEELEQRVAARTRALQESETKFRTLAEMATAGIFIFCREQVRYVNPAAERITGYAHEELLQMNFRHLIHSGFEIESPAHGSGELPQARHELRILAKDGHAKWIDFTTSPIDYQGEAAVLGTALDITDRKRLEEQLHDYMEDLERLVEQRTVRIKELERQRIETEKLAATGRMAARIAHEINNPLGIIQTACQLVSRAVPEGHRHYHHLGTIHKEIDRIAQIVRQMLDLHRPHREAPRPFHVEETIGEIVALMKPKAQESRVQLQLAVAHTGAPISLPENQLRQVLYNLLLNAVEASPPGGEVCVQVEIAANKLLLAVRDQGAGIPEEIGSRVFEPFFTTKNKSATGGLGLGLAICKSLVESMNGVIEFDSRSGQGTTFRVSVPLPSRGETHERIGPNTDCR